MPLLRGLDSLFEGQFSPQKLNRLFVPEGRERSRSPGIFLNKPLGLLDQSCLEHLPRALVDALVQRGPIRIKADPYDVEASQGIAPLPP